MPTVFRPDHLMNGWSIAATHSSHNHMASTRPPTPAPRITASTINAIDIDTRVADAKSALPKAKTATLDNLATTCTITWIVEILFTDMTA